MDEFQPKEPSILRSLTCHKSFLLFRQPVFIFDSIWATTNRHLGNLKLPTMVWTAAEMRRYFTDKTNDQNIDMNKTSI